MHKSFPIWVDSKNTSPYFLIAKGAHTITGYLYSCFPLIVELIFDLHEGNLSQTSNHNKHQMLNSMWLTHYIIKIQGKENIKK